MIIIIIFVFIFSVKGQEVKIRGSAELRSHLKLEGFSLSSFEAFRWLEETEAASDLLVLKDQDFHQLSEMILNLSSGFVDAEKLRPDVRIKKKVYLKNLTLI